MGIDEGIGIRVFLCSEIIVTSAMDMVGGSQKVKCELRDVIYSSS
jgi:hypothetical protein